MNNIVQDHSELSMEMHYDAFENIVHEMICRCFKERRACGERFLLEPLKRTDISEETQADTIQTLGMMRCREIPTIVAPYLCGPSILLQYKAIICGDCSSIDLLEKPLNDAKDELLRGYSATAIWQIWYEYSEATSSIVSKLKKALEREKSEIGMSLILLSLQTILAQNFGIREMSTQHIVRGNCERSKKKCLAYLAEHFEVYEEFQ